MLKNYKKSETYKFLDVIIVAIVIFNPKTYFKGVTEKIWSKKIITWNQYKISTGLQAIYLNF
jgi:hypothetical protein